MGYIRETWEGFGGRSKMSSIELRCSKCRKIYAEQRVKIICYDCVREDKEELISEFLEDLEKYPAYLIKEKWEGRLKQ